MDKKILFDKIFIVSGVSSGIGKEIAKILIDRYNAKVYGIARNEEKILNFKNQLNKPENFIGYSLFDVSNEDNWINFSKVCKQIRPNGLINCAGILPKFSSFDKSGVSTLKQVMDVNFYSCVYSCEHIIPLLNKESKSFVVNVSSSASLVTFSGISGYSASKSALKSFSLCLSSEYSNKINVLCVCPGVTDTGIFSNQNITEKESKLIKKLCSSPQKVAKKIVKAMITGKKLKIIGYDAKLMNFFYKLMPITTSKIITYILKKSGLQIFNEI